MNKTLLPESSARILIIDDNESIHEDIRKVLQSQSGAENDLMDIESDIFGEAQEYIEMHYEIDSAWQGKEGHELVLKARETGRPYAMAFVDMRMPPGWDGAETVKHIWDSDPDIEIVICTAYSDQSWSEVIASLSQSDKLIIMKKPFEIIEVQQMARALTTKWAMHRELKSKLNNLETEVCARVKDLEAINQKLQDEIKHRERMEIELRHSQKLEAVGQLAAGIAHEINTPIQFVGDSVQFLNTAFVDLNKLVTVYRKRYRAGASNADDDIGQMEKAVDLEYLEAEIPRAFDDTIEGIGRVASIVSAMKRFSHPNTELTEADINKAISTTLTVARSEYKYVAEIETEFDANLPNVTCRIGDLNQVFLNLIVNAVHAITDAKKETKGIIKIKTSHQDEYVTISIGDNGSGIPETVRSRIFEPFFTTKEVGRGTGQGLAIAHNIIVKKHAGKLTFDTDIGKGTTFHITIPVKAHSISAE